MLALSLLTLGMAALATASALPDFEMIEHRDVTGKTLHLPLKPVSVTGQFTKGGPNTTITGSHAEIAAQLMSFEKYWDEKVIHHANETEPSATNSTGLEKRSNRVRFVCDNGFGEADFGATATNLGYMGKHFPPGSMCQVAAKSCGRFACCYDAAVLMCNDNNYSVEVECLTMANNANFIMNSCGNPYWVRVEGQAFYINPSYNVLIKQTDPGKSC